MSGRDERYWNEVGRVWDRDRPQILWRAHSDAVNVRLLAAWLPEQRQGRLLKTDCFDEAVAGGVAGMLAARCARIFGIDLAPRILQRAVRPEIAFRLAAADVRGLPIRTGAFDAVVSLSTLDHFTTVGELLDALRELRRVCAPGATLVITLDNPQHPLLWLRGALPFRWLHRLGFVPYYVGVTLGARALRRALEEAGFAVEAERAILHVPRVLAIPLSAWVERRVGPGGRARWLRGLLRWEALERLPTRRFTAHFVGVRARAV